LFFKVSRLETAAGLDLEKLAGKKTRGCSEGSAFTGVCIFRTLLLADGVEKAHETAARAKVRK